MRWGLLCTAAVILAAGCSSEEPRSECKPENDQALCDRLALNCGIVTAHDSCGLERTVNCGQCSPPSQCGATGVPIVCAAGASGGTGGTGVAGGGGTGAAPYTCDPDGLQPSSKGSCMPVGPVDPCEECIVSKCCWEMEDCKGTDTNDPCWWGGPKTASGDYQGEIQCIRDCAKAGGEIATCADDCASPGCVGISAATNVLAVCLQSNCLLQCFAP